MDRETAQALMEGYRAIAGQPLQEGLFSWLFGKSKTPSQVLAEKVNTLFDKFYERENFRNSRRESRLSMEMPAVNPYEILNRLDTLRQQILREIDRSGKAFDKAAKDRDKAYKVRDSYSNKLDDMRGDRDSWRSRYNDAKHQK